jgi:hypothetical protein
MPRKGQFTSETAPRQGSPLVGLRQKFAAAFLGAMKPADLAKLARIAQKLAESGDVAALRELLDRCLGKAVQPVEVEAGESLADVLARLQAYKDAQAKPKDARKPAAEAPPS